MFLIVERLFVPPGPFDMEPLPVPFVAFVPLVITDDLLLAFCPLIDPFEPVMNKLGEPLPDKADGEQER